MKIRRILVYQVDLPLYEGSYKWSGGKSVEVFDSTVVRIVTDEDITGHGEVCPLGPVYMPAYAEGVRTGLAKLAPDLIGENPLKTLKLQKNRKKGRVFIHLCMARMKKRPLYLHGNEPPLYDPQNTFFSGK